MNELRAALIELHDAAKAHRCDRPEDDAWPINACGPDCFVERVIAALPAPADEEERPDFMAADRALAVPHRDDDQPCGCDDCMSYGAEDEGFDWYKVQPARRLVIRALDSGDDRLVLIATALRDHEAAASAPPASPDPDREADR